MRRLAYPEPQRRRRRRLHRPGQVGSSGYVGLELAPHVIGGAAVPVAPVQVILERVAQACFLADLLQAAPDRVDVHRAGPDQVPAEPGDAGPALSRRARIARTEPEGLVDPVSSHVDELGQVGPQRRVHLGHEHQAGGDGPAVEVSRLLEQKSLAKCSPRRWAKSNGGSARPFRLISASFSRSSGS